MPISTEPLWWSDLPEDREPAAALPECTDVLVVGSGYCGLSAAATLARAGREVIVLEAERAGFGASTRNAGFLGYELKTGLLGLARRFGEETAACLAREAFAAYRYTLGLIESEAIPCGLARNGRLVAAHSQRRLDGLVAELSARKGLLGVGFKVIPKMQIPNGRFRRTSAGACLVEEAATIQPALYHHGLRRRAGKAGATVVEHARVTALRPRRQGGFEVETAKGRIVANGVVLATNGYTGSEFPHLRRRVIPVASYMIATGELPPDRVAGILPRGRSFLDTRRIMTYARTTPDGRRIILGGRPSPLEVSPGRAARHYGRALAETFPALAGETPAFSWSGFTCFTEDGLPHIGTLDGVHYAVGYQGSGIALATYLGHKVALRVLGSEEGATPFADRAFSPFAFHFLSGIIVPTVDAWYRVLDRAGR